MRLIFLLVALVPAFSALVTRLADPNPTAYDLAEVFILGYTAIGYNELEWNATTILQANLDKIDSAASNGIGEIGTRERIFVVPEYALTTTRVISNLSLALEMAQLIGEPDESELPCTSTNGLSDYMVIKEVSCISRRHFVYLVTAVLEKEERNCTAGETEPCFRVYSTTIVTDRDGYLIRKYRRFNSLGETVLSPATEITPTYFTTVSNFTFGLLTGHDLLFREPTQSLLQSKVTHFLCNGAWKNTMPFEFSLNVFFGWARRIGSTGQMFLAASNYQEAELGYAGIGDYQTNAIFSSSSEIVPTGSGGYVATGTTLGLVSLMDSPQRRKQALDFPFEVNTEPADLSEYNTTDVPLSDQTAQVEACHGDFCCSLTYSTYSPSLTDVSNVTYQLLVFSGNRTDKPASERVFLEQTCGLVACARLSEDEIDCAGPRMHTNYTDYVYFRSLSLQGTFLTDSVRQVSMSGGPKYNSIWDTDLTIEATAPRNYTVTYKLSDGFEKVKTFALTATDIALTPLPPHSRSVFLAASSTLVLIMSLISTFSTVC